MGLSEWAQYNHKGPYKGKARRSRGEKEAGREKDVTTAAKLKEKLRLEVGVRGHQPKNVGSL